MLSKLPNEVMTIIFSYLTSVKDIINLAKVNKDLYLFYKSNNLIVFPDINLFQLPIIADFYSDEKELSIHEYFMTLENIFICFRLEYPFLYSKIVSLTYKTTKQYQYMDNMKHKLHHTKSFAQFRKLTKLIVDDKNAFLNNVPQGIKHFTTFFIPFNYFVPLITLKLIGFGVSSEKNEIKIVPHMIHNLEFSANQYKIPDLQSMFNLRHLVIRDLKQGHLSLPQSLKTLSINAGYNISINPLSDLELTHLTLKIKKHPLDDHAGGSNLIASYRLSNIFVKVLRIDYDCKNSFTNNQYHDHNLLHFPNAKHITIDINNHSYITDEDDIIDYLLCQYTDLDYLKIKMNDAYDSKLYNFRELKIEKCDLYNSMNFLSYYHSVINKYFLYVPNHNIVIPKTTKTFVYNILWQQDALIFDLPKLEYLKISLCDYGVIVQNIFKHKKINCIDIYHLKYCDLSSFECDTLIYTNNQRKITFVPPKKYTTLKLCRSILKNNLIHEDLEIIILGKDSTIEQCNLVNAKEIHLYAHHHLHLLTYKETCQIIRNSDPE